MMMAMMMTMMMMVTDNEMVKSNCKHDCLVCGLDILNTILFGTTTHDVIIRKLFKDFLCDVKNSKCLVFWFQFFSKSGF